MNAQPGPMVSGSHFFPKAPLLWVKWMPAWAVMSRNVTCAGATIAAAGRNGNTHHRYIEAQRKALLALSFWLLAKGQRLRANSENFLLKERITFGPRESWCGLLPGFARLDGRMRPSLRGSWLLRE